MTQFDPSNLLAEIEADDAAEAQALADRQQRRRAALEPAALLAAEIATSREHFLAEDRQRLTRLAELVKEAKKNGAPAAKLHQLKIVPLTVRPHRARSRSTTTKTQARRKPPPPTRLPHETSPSLAREESAPTSPLHP